MRTIQLIKDNTMLLIAGLAIVGFSSFKMIDKFEAKSGAVTKWYPVATNGQTIDTLNPQDNPPADSECQESNLGNTCFIKMTTTASVPTSVNAALSDPTVSDIEQYHRDE
ncbi:hypothetical protein [Sphingobacterium prati]|uniref:hypothetical protein n=1 Tax=Sphingobacterium prati TaxID=2737006 RepID=UPI001552F539|nr:hypothetical protein [Sphingobacterium prati]NPE47785.1 hypothetical protein [Sphingobacterium prati]